MQTGRNHLWTYRQWAKANRDYASTGLSLKAQPVKFLRPLLKRERILSTEEIYQAGNHTKVKIAGIVTVRQRPCTAGGVCFMTIEDEFGFANLVIWESLFEKFRAEILRSKLIMVSGKIQRQGRVVHVVVQRCYNYSDKLNVLSDAHQGEQLTLNFSRADERSAPYQAENKRTQLRYKVGEEAVPGARNFK